MTLKHLFALAGLSVCLMAPGCPSPTPPVPPTPPAVGGDTSTGGSAATGGQTPVAGAAGQAGGAFSTPEEKACANLAKLGCPEGIATKCAGDMARRCVNPKVKCDTACLIEAATKSEIQTKCHLACGGL